MELILLKTLFSGCAVALAFLALSGAAVGEIHRSTITPTSALRNADGSSAVPIIVWYPAQADAHETPLVIGPDNAPLFATGSAAADAPPAAGRYRCRSSPASLTPLHHQPPMRTSWPSQYQVRRSSASRTSRTTTSWVIARKRGRRSCRSVRRRGIRRRRMRRRWLVRSSCSTRRSQNRDGTFLLIVGLRAMSPITYMR